MSSDASPVTLFLRLDFDALDDSNSGARPNVQILRMHCFAILFERYTEQVSDCPSTHDWSPRRHFVDFPFDNGQQTDALGYSVILEE